MNEKTATRARPRRTQVEHPRDQLLAGIPVTERRLDLAGVATAVLEGGAGPPLVLLHGPGAYGASWQQVVPSLVTTHRVVAPDLPGHGSSSPLEQGSDADAVVDWLGELIDRTCSAPPVLVGQLVGGAIAARLAADRGDRLERLVLVVPFGLEPFLPTPTFGAALTGYLTAPSETSHDELWDQCVYDLEALRRRPSVRWEAMKAYNVELAASGDSVRSLQLLMELFGFPALPEEMLGRIAVPTTLIWGRRDSIVPLAVGERASTRFGWPLRVIESVGNEPAVEAPDAFVQALLDDTTTGEETAR